MRWGRRGRELLLLSGGADLPEQGKALGSSWGSLGRSILAEATASSRAPRWLLPGGFEEQLQGQCGWSEVDENESNRRGSQRTCQNVDHCEGLGSPLREVGSPGEAWSGRGMCSARASTVTVPAGLGTDRRGVGVAAGTSGGAVRCCPLRNGSRA